MSGCFKVALRLFTAFAVAIAGASGAPAVSQVSALVGGTVIDLRSAGNRTGDIPNAVVVIRNGVITAVGPKSSLHIPRGARVIDARGRYIVPGLIDGFASLRSQGFAKAFLYHGVTSVVAPAAGQADERRGATLTNLSPAPHLLPLALMNGYSYKDDSDTSMTSMRLHQPRLSNAALEARVGALADQGVRLILIHYNTWPDQTARIVAAAKRRGIGVIGELGWTPYPDALRAGVQAFVHDQRYMSELAPAPLKAVYADAPFDGAAIRPVIAVERTISPDDPIVTNYGAAIARSHTALMPTLAIAAHLRSEDLPNPWSDPAAALIKPEELHDPIDRASGRAPRWLKQSPEQRATNKAYIDNMDRIDRRFHSLGARYLAASGTSAFGVMPGQGLHLELARLQQIGLTPREALAAATSNYAEFFGLKDIGVLGPGRRADILVLRTDPRRSVKAVDDIDMVILGGQVLDRESLLR